MPNAEMLLEIENVSASYGAINALTDVSLHVCRGEIVALIGANGAGKSTLLMTLFGNPRPKSGRIKFAGKEITDIPTHKISGLGIAQVPEGRRVFPRMTVLENLHMGTMNRGGKLDESELEYIWKLFPRLLERYSQMAGTLSGGEQQMLAIGRALASKPQLLLLDEPSLGLAPLIVKQIMDNLREIAAGGTTIFLVEQNAHQALRLASRGYVLVNGKISLTGTGQELLSNPEVQNAYLGGH